MANFSNMAMQQVAIFINDAKPSATEKHVLPIL
jgi:hypothetical protein